MKQRNASRTFAALVAVTAVGGAGLAATAQTQQPYPPPPGVPVQTPAPATGPSTAPATGQGAPARRPRGELPQSDAEFAVMFSAINTAELDEAKYMLNRTTNPMVREYAQHMIDDHSTAEVKLQAATRGVALPGPRERHANGLAARGVETLSQMSGAQRDNAYMRMQVVAHRRALDIVQWEAQNGKVATLKTLASDTLPTIDNHARMALAYQASGGTSMTVEAAAPAGTAPQGTLPNPPATTTSGSENAAGAGTRRGNTVTNPSNPPTLSQPTTAPGTQPSSAPAPSPSPT